MDGEVVEAVEPVQMTSELWGLVLIGSRGTRRRSGVQFNDEASARRVGAGYIGLVMR